MKRVTKQGYEDGLFDSWRSDPEFVLNQSRYADPRVLVTGANFGSGSSREHAVWALRDYGFRAVLAPSFADIFQGNAGKQGLLAAVVNSDEIDALWDAVEAHPAAPIQVDLQSRLVQLGERTWAIEVDEHTRWRLMEGVDDIDLTLRSRSAIDWFEAQRAACLPRTLPVRPAVD